MSEEKNAAENADQYADALENVKNLKVTVSDAKAALRKFKKANKVRKAEDIKDDKDGKILAEFTALEEAVTAAQTAWEEAKAATQELKPVKQRGGGGSYAYGQIADPESGDMRDLEKSEQKRWRTHARKVAKKEEGVASEVPFDPDFFVKKVAKKDKEEAKPDAKEEAKPDAKEDTPKAQGRSRRRNKD